MMNLAEYRRTASRLADYLPWVALVGEGVVLNKDGSFQRTAKFRGPDLDSAVAAELVAVAGRLNNAFRRLGSGCGPCGLWPPPFHARHFAPSAPGSEYSTSVRTMRLRPRFTSDPSCKRECSCFTGLMQDCGMKEHSHLGRMVPNV